MDSLLQFTVRGQTQLEQLLYDLTHIDTQRILDEGASILFHRTLTRFLQETDPTGTKWEPSKAAIWRSTHGKGGGTLFDTGRLFRSIQLYADSTDSRAIGTNVVSPKGVPYARKHQFGIGIERRQFLGFGPEDVQTMSDLVMRRVLEGLQA